MKNIELDANDLWNNSRYTSGLEFDGSKVLDAIPGNGLLHRFESLELSANDTDAVNTWPDEAGASDLTGGSPTYRTGQLNGNPVVRFNGTDDLLNTDIPNISQPLQYFFVGQWQDTSGGPYAVDGGENFENSFGISNGNYRIVDSNSNNNEGSTADTNGHLWDVLAETDNIELFLDGISDVSSSSGGDTHTGIALGGQNDGTNSAQIDVAALLVYETSASGFSATDVRDYLYDRYGDGSAI